MSIEKIPPQAIEIERAVLSAFMASLPIFTKYGYLIKPEYFYNAFHRKIFNYMIKNNCTDILIISNQWPEETNEIAEISTNYSPSLYLEQEIEILKDRYERRFLIESAQEGINTAFSNYDLPAKKIIEETISKINISDSYESKPEHIQNVMPRVFDQIEKCATTGAGLGLKTGISSIDEMIGGLVDGEMVMIAGRPSMGKTALALQIAAYNAIEQHVPVLIFSIETSNEQITGRIMFASAGVSYDLALRGQLPKRDFSRLAIAVGPLSEAQIYIDETPAISIMQLVAKSENYAKNYGIKLIIIDHIGLVTDPERGRSRHEELGKISKHIKSLGKSLHIPTITLCQLSREVEKRQPPIPRLSDLFESGSLEQDTDKVIFLYREEYYIRSSTKQNIAEIILAKNKNGKTGYKEVRFDKPTMTFQNLEKEIDYEATERKDLV